MNANKRGSGRTTRQIKEAPIGSIFLVHNENARDYTRRLTLFLGRGDLHVITISRLHREARGKRDLIVVDHEARWHMNWEDRAFVEEFNARLQ